MTIKFEGAGFTGLLFLVFLVLKLCNVINWSWWWVTAPLWIPVAFVIIVAIIWLIAWLICCLIQIIKG